jgi:hypothetical protein
MKTDIRAHPKDEDITQTQIRNKAHNKTYLPRSLRKFQKTPTVCTKRIKTSVPRELSKNKKLLAL